MKAQLKSMQGRDRKGQRRLSKEPRNEAATNKNRDEDLAEEATCPC